MYIISEWEEELYYYINILLMIDDTVAVQY